MENILKYLDLTETEYEVYLVLVRAGRSPANQIIKLMKLHRGTVYDIINRLIQKGLVSYIDINKKRYYNASRPERLLEIIKEKEAEIESSEKLVKKLVNDISKMELIKKGERIVEVYESKKGLRTLMQDLLTVKEFLGIGGEIQFQEILPVYTRLWANEREKKKVFAKILTTKSGRSKWKYNKLRRIPKEFMLPNPTIIYGDKVAILSFEERPLSIIMIESKNIALTYRNHFNLLWKRKNNIKS